MERGADMKAIMISIRPEWIAKILNGKKTIEIRKRFPKDYVGWVYIYCTKEQGLARLYNGRWNDTFVCEKDITDNEFKRMYSGYDGKGKVVARFWCDKVEETHIYAKNHEDNALLKNSCLTVNEFMNYLGNKSYGYAIHITKVKPFDKPKEIKEFNVMREYTNCGRCPHALEFGCSSNGWCGTIKSLTRAPQSFMFIEI